MNRVRWNSLLALALAGIVPVACVPVANQPAKPDAAATSMTPAPSPDHGKSSADVTMAPAAVPVTVTPGSSAGSLYYPSGDAASSVLLIEKTLPTEVQANKPFMYDIKVTNVTKLSLEGVEIEETVPGSFKIKDVTDGSPDGKPNTVTYLVGGLNAGDSKIVRLQGTATQAGVLGMCLSAKYNTSLCMTTNVVSPQLKIVAVGPTDVMFTDQPGYKFTVTNTGSGEAKNVHVEAVLPDGLTTPDGKASVKFEAGTLAASESRDFAFVTKPSRTGTYPIKATATADEGLTGESQTVTTAVRRPMLQIVKTGPEKAFIGQQIAYEITVTNKGDGVAKDTLVIDNLPAGATVQAASDNGKADATGKVRWEIGDLAPGATKKVAVVVTADQAGDMKSAASVSAVGADVAAAFAQTTLSGVPAIGVTTVDNPDPVKVGDNTTYTIEITNQGTAAGTNIKLVCTLEDPMDFVSATGPTKQAVSGKTVTFEALGSLAPKTKAIYKVIVKANKVAQVQFKTSISSDQLGRPVEQTEATNFFGQ